jgi:hypothetical protein
MSLKIDEAIHRDLPLAIIKKNKPAKQTPINPTAPHERGPKGFSQFVSAAK